MIAARLRLLLRQYRLEAWFFGVAMLGAAAGLVIVAMRTPALLATCQLPTAAPDCTFVTPEAVALQALTGLGSTALVLVPVFAGLVLGIAVVGREVERGTATLAWSLGRSRRRWLLGRTVAIGLSLLAVSLVLAAANAAAMGAWHPGEDLARSFAAMEINGIIAVARGLAALGLGLLAGAVMGKMLPGLLLGALAIVLCITAVNLALERWVRSEAVILGSFDYSRDRIVDQLYRDRATGAMLTQDEVWSTGPPPDDPNWPQSVYDEVALGVPADRAPEYVALACALYAGAALLAVGATVLVVDHRRPS